MPSRTMGEERDWARLLKALEDIARNTGRIADALDQPQKEHLPDGYLTEADRDFLDRVLVGLLRWKQAADPGGSTGQAADPAAGGAQG